jgi:hypothetical protein
LRRPRRAALIVCLIGPVDFGDSVAFTIVVVVLTSLAGRDLAALAPRRGAGVPPGGGAARGF